MVDKIKIEYLLPEQLRYELTLREVEVQDLSNRELTKNLRAALQEEAKQGIPELTFLGDKARDFHMVVSYINALKVSSCSAPSDYLTEKVRVQIWHLENRLNRLGGEQSPVDEREINRAKEELADLEATLLLVESLTKNYELQGKKKAQKQKQTEPKSNSKLDLSSTLKTIMSEFFQKQPGSTPKRVSINPNSQVMNNIENWTYELDSDEKSNDSEEEHSPDHQQKLTEFFGKLTTMVEEYEKSKGEDKNRSRSREKDREPRERQRTPTPVRSWNIRWSGDEKKDDMALRQFFKLIERMAAAKNYNSLELLNNAHYLLAGKARQFFFTNYGDWNSWVELKTAFIRKFMPEEPDLAMLDKIGERKQGEQEATLDYIEAIQNLCYNMDSRPSEKMSLHLIIKNMREPVRLQVKPFSRFFSSVDDLIQHCKNIDDTIGRPKRRYDGYRNVDEVKKETESDPAFESFELKYMRPSAPNPSNQPIINSGAQNIGYQNPNAYTGVSGAWGGTVPKQGTNTGNRRYILQCWNCNSVEHTYVNCSQPILSPFCFKCGRKGTVTPRCPICHPTIQDFRDQRQNTNAP